MRNQRGILDKLVKEQTNSLDSKLKQVTSSWERFVLTIDSGKGGLSGFFKDVLSGFSGVLNQISDIEKAMTVS